jgi:superfamily II helicase
MEKRETCELCLWEQDASVVKAVEIDGQTHYICMRCEGKIANAPYADERAAIAAAEGGQG